MILLTNPLQQWSGNKLYEIIMTMNSKISYLIILFLIILGLHLLGVFAGLYERQIPIDFPQHILAGVIFGLIWLRWLKPEARADFSKWIIFVSILGFVTLLGSLWEILEFVVWKLFPAFVNSFKFYSPTVGELLDDVVANLIGGVLVGLYAVRKKDHN